MPFPFPKIDGRRFATNLIRIKAKKVAGSFLEPLGPGGIAWCVEKSVPLADVIVMEKLQRFPPQYVARFLERNLEKLRTMSAAEMPKYRERARQYAWAASTITVAGLQNMLPEWAHGIIATEQGQKWWEEQVIWLAAMFRGGK